MKIFAAIAIAACTLLSACAGDGYRDNGYRQPSHIDPFKPRGGR